MYHVASRTNPLICFCVCVGECVLHTVIVNMSRRSPCLSGQSGRGSPYFTYRVYPASLERGHSPGCNILTHTQPSSCDKKHFIARVSAAIQPTELIKKKGAAGVFCRLLPNWHRTRDACLIQMPQTLDVAPQGSWRVYWRSENFIPIMLSKQWQNQPINRSHQAHEK